MVCVKLRLSFIFEFLTFLRILHGKYQIKRKKEMIEEMLTETKIISLVGRFRLDFFLLFMES